MIPHSLREFVSNSTKIKRFDDINFIRWQKKMHFLLAGLKVLYVLTTPKPKEVEDETIADARAWIKWEPDDNICKEHICNAKTDLLFDIYYSKQTAKDVLGALEEKYLMEYAINKKFLVIKIFNY